MRDPSPGHDRGAGRLISLALIAALLLGVVILRFVGLNWNQHQQVHPDERFIVWVVDMLPGSTDLATAFDPDRSTINPFRGPPGSGILPLPASRGSTRYGHFPFDPLAAVAHAAQAAALRFGPAQRWLFLRLFTHSPPSDDTWRSTSTSRCEDAPSRPLPIWGRCCWCTRWAGGSGVRRSREERRRRREAEQEEKGEKERREKGGRVGGEQGVWNTHDSTTHHGATPPASSPRPSTPSLSCPSSSAISLRWMSILTFCLPTVVALAARWVYSAQPADPRRGAGLGTRLLAGVMAGLAVGSKFSAVLLALPLAVAALKRLPAVSLGRKALSVAGRLAAAGAVALVVFVLTNPFAVIDSRPTCARSWRRTRTVSGLMGRALHAAISGHAALLLLCETQSASGGWAGRWALWCGAASSGRSSWRPDGGPARRSW